MNKIISIIVSALLLTSCAKGVPVSACTNTSHIYGFWGGLWHGIIAPFDLICMIFSDSIVVYAPNNNGGWYALGFCLGAGILFGGSSKATKK
jgi:hypothetical protein